jgi:hypothetical protein
MRFSVKSLRALVLLSAWVFAGLPAWAFVDVVSQTDYLQGSKPDEAGCPWEADMVSSASVGANRSGTASGAVGQDLKVVLHVADLKLTRASSKSSYAVTVRADVMHDARLLATRDFQDDDSFKSEKLACDTLRALGKSLGESAGNWMFETNFPQCQTECTDIHPDESIAIGQQILLDSEDAISEQARDGCHWPTAMVSKVIEAFNQGDPPPRAKLELRAGDIERVPGRRLVLRVNNMHAVGGGGFSGPKWLAMSGQLLDGKLLVGSFEAQTTTMRGGLTTCRTVDSLSDSATSMIVDWLRSPSIGSKLD